jgi:hypothetical protein
LTVLPFGSRRQRCQLPVDFDRHIRQQP